MRCHWRAVWSYARALTVGMCCALPSACNQLFYYPDRVVYTTPDKLALDYSEHHVKAADGTDVVLWHMPSIGIDRHAVVVQLHGNAQNMSAHLLFVAWLAQAGFDVVTFDYRGYGQSGGRPERAGMLSDGQAVLNWLVTTPELRGKEVILFGQSLGGAVAVPLAAAAPVGQLRLLVVESTFDSYRRLARAKLASVWLTWPFQYPLSFLITDELSPVDSAPQLKLPFLQIHGDADPVIPLASGQALFRAVGAKDKEFWLVPNGGHIGSLTGSDSPYRQRLVNFICKHLSHPQPCPA